MPVAYFITCHQSKDFVSDQIQFIYNAENVYIYHVDPKSPQEIRTYVEDLSRTYKNILLMPSRSYSWAGFSQVSAVIEAMRIALNSERDWTHFIPLSEQHLPTVEAESVAHRLATDTSYMGNTPYSALPPQGQTDIHHRFDNTYIELAGVGGFAVGKSDLGSSFYEEIRHGSNWYILNRKLCVALCAYFDNNKEIEKFKYCVHGDENVIVSLAHSSCAGIGKIENIETTFVAWPHLTDNPDMIFSEENFFQARLEEKLFIRKRPQRLPESVRADLMAKVKGRVIVASQPSYRKYLGHFRNVVRTIYKHDRFSRINPAHIRNALQEKLPDGQWTLYQTSVFANIPEVLIRYKTNQLPNDLSIFVISQDCRKFKIALVTDYATDTPFVDREIYGYSAFLLRVRVAHLFFHYELSIPHTNHGFVSLTDPADTEPLVRILRIYLNQIKFS